MTGRRNGVMRWLHWVLGLAILGGLALAAAKYLKGPEIMAAIARFNWAYAAPILVLSALYLLLKAWWFALALRRLSSVPFPLLLRAYIAGQPATLLPGGIAARAGLLAEVGIPGSTSSAPVVLNSVFDQVCFLLLALVGALWYPPARSAALGMAAGFAGVALLLIIPLTRRWLAWLLEVAMRRFKLGEQYERLAAAFTQLASWRLLGSGFGITLVAKIMLVVILGLCLRTISHDQIICSGNSRSTQISCVQRWAPGSL